MRLRAITSICYALILLLGGGAGLVLTSNSAPVIWGIIPGMLALIGTLLITRGARAGELLCYIAAGIVMMNYLFEVLRQMRADRPVTVGVGLVVLTVFYLLILRFAKRD